MGVCVCFFRRALKKKMIVICACSPRPTETFCSAPLRCEHILGQWVPRKEPKSHSRIYSRPRGNIKNIGVTVGPRSLSAAMKTVIFSQPAPISDSHEVTSSLNSSVQSHFWPTLSDVTGFVYCTRASTVWDYT